MSTKAPCVRCRTREVLVLWKWCSSCAPYLLAITHDEALRAALWKAIGYGPLPKHRCEERCPGRDPYPLTKSR